MTDEKENTLENAEGLAKVTYEITKLAGGSVLKALGMSVLIQVALIESSRKSK